MIYTLRDYQQESVDKIRSAMSMGFRAPLLQLPTGGGKTVIFCHIAEQAAAKGKRVYILVHRQELLRQTSKSLSEMRVEHGLIAAGKSMSLIDPVQIASVQTIVRRIDKIPPPDLIIIDEAHHAVAGTWQKILDAFPKALHLGVTATPIRMDGRGLGKHCGGYFDALINGPTMRWMIERGYLSQPLVYAPPSGVDFGGVKMVAGDYNKKEINHRMDKPTITGCAIDHYQRLCQGMPAIAFCASVMHAEHVAEQFDSAGIPAASIDGKMQSAQRERRIKDLASGQIKVLTSCDIISEGTDIPIVGAAILLRPTKSLGLNMQQVGRALRPYPGKSNAVILDHVGNVMRHGLPDQDRVWTLDGQRRSGRRKNDDEADVAMRMCQKCFACFGAHTSVCPQCGTRYMPKVNEIKQVDGQLRQISEFDVKAKAPRYDRSERAHLNRLIAKCKARGMSVSDGYRLLHRMKKKNLLIGA